MALAHQPRIRSSARTRAHRRLVSTGNHEARAGRADTAHERASPRGAGATGALPAPSGGGRRPRDPHLICVPRRRVRYKLKKPLVLDFLDYRTAARRREMCREEVRLNRRLAPDLYVGVRGVALSVDGVELTAEDAPQRWITSSRCVATTRPERCLRRSSAASFTPATWRPSDASWLAFTRAHRT